MFNSLLLKMVRYELGRVKLPFQAGDAPKDASDTILGIFERGFEIGLMGKGLEQAETAAEEIAWNRRCFYWEGYACGLAGDARLRFKPIHPEHLNPTGHYRSMCFTGYGMWNGLAAKLPFLRIPSEDAAWSQTQDYPSLRPLLIGGDIFGQIVFRDGLSKHFLEQAAASGDEIEVLGTQHGFGRALWWFYMDNQEGAQSILEQHPNDAQGIAEGVGLAIGFINLADPRRIPKIIEGFDPIYYAALLRGVGVCLEAMREEHPEYGPRIAKLDVPLLSRAQKLAQMINDDVPHGPMWYAGCAARLRKELPSPSQADLNHDTGGAAPEAVSSLG